MYSELIRKDVTDFIVNLKS